MHDLLIRGATVHDGTGRPGRQADVAIAGDRIAAIGPDAARERAARTIDGGGLVLAPGFIDLHSHADFTLPSYPGALNSLAQGVTSEVIGNCGYTPAPVSPDPAKAAAHRTNTHGLGPDLDWSWHTYAEYLDRLDAARPAVNALPLVGFGAVRTAIVGPDDRPATPGERIAMAAEVETALAAGAWGLSTGLVYPPGSFATRDEIIETARPLARHGALYATHMRSEAGGSGSVAAGVLRWQTNYVGTLTVLPRPSGGVCAAFRVNNVSLHMTSPSTATLMYSVVVCDGSREGTATVTRSP